MCKMELKASLHKPKEPDPASELRLREALDQFEN